MDTAKDFFSMTVSVPFRAACVALSLVLLAGCDSAEERAEGHYDRAIELLSEGDVQRAFLEFRNVLQLVPAHMEALAAYAEALEAEEQIPQAYRLRLRLAELSPDSAEANLSAAEMGVELLDWENAEAYAARAFELVPDDPRSEALRIALAYREGFDDPAVRQDLLQQARALRETLPESRILRTVELDALIQEGDDEAALAEADALIADYPDNLQFHRARLQILNRMGDQEALEAGLRELVTQFPEDDANKELLIRYYLSRGDLDSVETFLRDQITEGEADDEPRLTLVQFLMEARGREAALAELDRLIEEGTNPDRFRATRAALLFEGGETEEAISILNDILETAEPSEQTRDIKALLARLLVATGNEVGARQLVEEVLAEDPGHVDALKLRAAWLIDEDETDEAIGVLRRALDQAPNDPELLTQMAQAHLRSGNRELAGEMLSQAVSTSNNSVPETLRYASFLVADGRLMPAESILIDALRLAPDTVNLLVPLGEIYIQLEDWPRAEQVERQLREIGTEEAVTQADALRVSLLGGQRRNADAIAFLENLAQSDDAEIGARVAIVRSHLASGDIGEARTYLDTLLDQDPDNDIYRFLDAALLNAAGDHAAAEERYRALIEDYPDNERLRIELYRTLRAAERPQEAMAALEAALEAVPEGLDLLWIRASELERAGDIEGAIAIYERMYDQNSGNSIIANNLASLLSTARQDEESLNRAWQVARRLRDTDIPAFLDTYGWIAFRRGDLDEALRHLEPAAAGLPQDPQVRYHLGLTYGALGRQEDALEALRQAVELAEAADYATAATTARAAREEIGRLESGQ